MKLNEPHHKVILRKLLDAFADKESGLMPDQHTPCYAGLSRCWGWHGSTFRGGYAAIQIKNWYYAGHRVSYFLRHGDIPDKMVIRHRCDNKICTNPDHLEIGTPSQNTREAHERGLVKKGRLSSKPCQTSKDELPFLVAGVLVNEFGVLAVKMHSTDQKDREEGLLRFRRRLQSIFRDCYAMANPDRRHLHPKEAKRRILSLDPYNDDHCDEFNPLSYDWSQDLDNQWE